MTAAVVHDRKLERQARHHAHRCGKDQTFERYALVRKAAVAFDRALGNALTRSASCDLILKVAEE